MRRLPSVLLVSSLLIVTFITSPRGDALANGGACPTCVAKLDITSAAQRLGDITRDADSTYQSWGAGSVKLTCDDGSAYDTVDLGLEPYDLESGIDLQDATLPDVDLTAGGLECQIDVNDGLQSSVIDVDLI